MKIILDGFIAWLKAKGYKHNTISNYFISINKFLAYLAREKINYFNFPEKNFLNFITEYTTGKSKQSKNSYIYAILKYCDFLKETKGVTIEIKNIPIERAGKKNFKRVENIDNLSSIILKNDKVTAERDNLLIMMLYETGLKTKELIKIKLGNVKNDWINIGGKIIILNKKLLKTIFNFCLKNNIKCDQYLFFSYQRRKKNFNSPITERAAQIIVKRLKEITKNDFSINDLRKSLSANIFSDNIKITSIFKHFEFPADEKSYLEF
ncbi:MAG: tyrosine-type recombinase/integrase [Patescibacteria group bacterium]|nr:tyrosine-type recombinase/integrase [Patescibacteria group bacterium]